MKQKQSQVENFEPQCLVVWKTFKSEEKPERRRSKITPVKSEGMLSGKSPTQW